MVRGGRSITGTSVPPAQSARPVQAAPPEGLKSDFDTQLMLQVRGGDREAAGLLIRRNYERVARYIARVVRDARAVEDLTQDVFAQILASARRYEATAKFTTWAYRIATNTAIKFIQSRPNLQKPRQDEAELVAATDEGSGPTAKMDFDELRGRVHSAMERLQPNQKAATVLYAFEGLSYEQVASVMGVTEDAVRALLARARAALRSELAGLME